MNIDTGILSIALAVLTFFLGRVTNAKKDGESDGEMRSDIKHIIGQQEEMKEDIRQYGLNYTEVRSELERIKERVTKLEEIIKIYHQEGAL